MTPLGPKLGGMTFLCNLSCGGHVPAYKVASKGLQFMGLLDP